MGEEYKANLIILPVSLEDFFRCSGPKAGFGALGGTLTHEPCYRFEGLPKDASIGLGPRLLHLCIDSARMDGCHDNGVREVRKFALNELLCKEDVGEFRPAVAEECCISDE